MKNKHKISFIGSLLKFIKTLLKVVIRSYKTSFLMTYGAAIAVIVGIVFMRKNNVVKGGGMVKTFMAFDEAFLIYDQMSVKNQLISSHNTTENKFKLYTYEKSKEATLKDIVTDEFSFIFDIDRPTQKKIDSLGRRELYKQYKLFTEQTGLDSFEFFAGGQFEFNENKLSKITSAVNTYKFPFKGKNKNALQNENEQNISSANSAYLHTQYMAKTLSLEPPQIFFPQRDTPFFLQNGPLVMFLSIMLLGYTIFTSGNIAFYKDLAVTKITKFLNIIGYSLFVQFLATHLVSIIMTLPFTICCAIGLQQFLSNTGELSAQELIMNVLWLIHLQYVMNCAVLSLYNLLPQFLVSMANFIFSVGFFAMTLQKLPGGDSKLYSVYYYTSPINAIIYFLWFQITTDYRTFGVFKHLKVPFKHTTLLTVLLIQFSLSLVLTILSYILYRMDTDILTSLYIFINKYIKRMYNLITRKNRKIDTKLIKNNKSNKIIENREIKLEDTKDRLVIDQLSKSYTTFGSKVYALEGINLELIKGEKVALLGHNGCGKTTLLDSLIGILNRSSGQVYLNGSKITGTTDLQTKLGYCPQFTKTIPSLSVFENLQLVSDLYNVPQSEAKDILIDLELYRHKSKQANQLSGGQKRKLGFAMAVIAAAPLIVLDEPTTGIDVLSRKVIFKLLRKYSADSIVIFSTHLIEEAEDYADKVAILSQGRLMAFDTVTNIKRKFNIIFNRLRVNFLESIDEEFIKQLIEDYSLALANKTNKVVNLEIKETNYEHLASLYRFMEEKRNECRVESYGVYKASLEEVLNLQEFREINTSNLVNDILDDDNNNKYNDYKQIEDIGIPAKNMKKKPSSLSTVKAILYHTFISIISNYTTLASLVVISVGVFLCFNYSRNTLNTDFNNNNDLDKNSFKIINFNAESFQLNGVRKARIKTFNIREEANLKFIKYIKEESSMKDSIYVKEIPRDKVKGIFDKSTIDKKELLKTIESNNKANKEKYGDDDEHQIDPNDEREMDRMKEHKISQRILALTNTEECDLFIFEVTKKEMGEMFNIGYLSPELKKFLKQRKKDEKEAKIYGHKITMSEDDHEENNRLVDLEERLSKERVLMVIQKYNDDIYSFLFSFLYTEHNVRIVSKEAWKNGYKGQGTLIEQYAGTTDKNKENANNVEAFTQQVILNKDYINRKAELQPSHWISFFIFAIFSLTIGLVSDKLVEEKESGIHNLWFINGIPKLVVFLFNITIYSVVTFLSMTLPILIMNGKNYTSISSFLMDPYLTYLLICIMLIALIFGLLSHIFHKQAIMGLKNGVVSLTFMSHMLKGVFSMFLKYSKTQYYLFWNPFYTFYELLLVILRGEIHIKTKGEYYMFYNSSTGPIHMSNWAMSNYIQTYLTPFLTIETVAVFLAALLAVFRVFTLINERIKRAEFKNVKALSNTNMDNINNDNTNNNKASETEDKRVVLKNVTKIYGHKMFFNANYALKNFNLKANKGNSIGVLGANGGGKTTAFKLLTRELEPTFGDLFFNNQRLSNIKSGYMGYVPQYEALPLHMTPYQVLNFYAILYNWKGIKTENYIQSILDLMKLKKNKYKKISTLSGGNKRKVVLAISILLNRELLILDEPTTGVDITNCQDIWDVVQSKTKDKTVLLASHSTRESEQLTNKIIILIEGVIVASGTKEAIREEHGKYYEVEIEMYENDNTLKEKLYNLKGRIEGRFENIRIVIKNNFKFSCFIEKKQIDISRLIELFAKWREEFSINEFFVNESTLEDILMDKLTENQRLK